jgi:beta-galactosidase
MKRQRGWKEGYGQGTIGNTGKMLGVTENALQSTWQYRRGAGFTLGAGVYESFFDLHGGYFDDPKLMEEVKHLNSVFDESTQYDRSSCAEILVVSDETSCSYAGFRSSFLEQSMQPPQPILVKIGAPHDSILVDDLALLDTNRYKLILFLNAYHLTDAQRELIRRKALLPGKTIVWCYAPGLFNQNRTLPEAMAALTGFKIVPAGDETRVAPRIALIESGHPLSRKLKAAGLTVIGPEGKSCKLFSVQESDATILGTLPGSGAATLAFKQVDAWNSIYAITPALPAAFYQVLARRAGVHIYNNNTDDTLYVSKSYLTLSANRAGSRTIKFPTRCDVFDPFTNQRLYQSVTEFTRDFQDLETLIVRYG